MTLIFGLRDLIAVAIPEISPPPPTGHKGSALEIFMAKQLSTILGTGRKATRSAEMKNKQSNKHVSKSSLLLLIKLNCAYGRNQYLTESIHYNLQRNLYKSANPERPGTTTQSTLSNC